MVAAKFPGVAAAALSSHCRITGWASEDTIAEGPLQPPWTRGREPDNRELRKMAEPGSCLPWGPTLVVSCGGWPGGGRGDPIFR